MFNFNVYGTVLGMFGHNATLNATVDCGSHCDMYGVPPGERRGECTVRDLCELVDLQQPLQGRKSNGTCMPEPGYALIPAPGYAWVWIFPWPGWFNVTFDAKTASDERIFCVTAEVCVKWQDPKKNGEYKQGPWTRCEWPY
ncbi:hypothetical protein LTR95_004462 [Oleoguttula sp. CCFEE 5521]